MSNNQETASTSYDVKHLIEQFNNVQANDQPVKLSRGQRRRRNKRQREANNANILKDHKLTAGHSKADVGIFCEWLTLQTSKIPNEGEASDGNRREANEIPQNTSQDTDDEFYSLDGDDRSSSKTQSTPQRTDDEFYSFDGDDDDDSSSVSSHDSEQMATNEFKEEFKEKCNEDINHPWKDKFQNCSKYCIHKAAKFRQETLKWLKNPVKKEEEYISKDSMAKFIPLQLETMPSERDEPYAVYRIITFSSGKYYLTPIYREIFATDRADLRLVQLDDLAVCRNNRSDFWMGSLFDGDLIDITAMSPTYKMPNNGLPEKNDDPNIVIQMDYKPLWRVDEFFVMLRKYKKDALVCLYNAGSWKNAGTISLAGFGLDRPIKIKESCLPANPKIGNLYKTDLFIPYMKIDRFLKGKLRNSNDYYQLSRFASSLLFFSPPALTPVNIREADGNISESLRSTTTAFQNLKSPMNVLKFGLRFSASMIATVSNDTFDYQVYNSPFEIVKKGRDDADIFVNFKIRKDTGPPSIGLWKPSTKINLVIPQGKIRGVVQSSVLMDGHLVVTARFAEENVSGYRQDLVKMEKSKIAVVEQVEGPKDVVLTNLFGVEDEMKSTSNGYQLLCALFGGAQIVEKKNDIHNLRHVRLINSPCFYLDWHQNRYVDLVRMNYPGIVANSPFGCGKTTTMAVTQLELCEKMPERIHLTLGMTNSSVVNLVEAAARLETDEMEANILRLISLSNRHESEKNIHTDFDFPIIRDQVLTKFVLDFDKKQQMKHNFAGEQQMANFKLAIAYLIYNDLIDIGDLCSSFGRDSYCDVKNHFSHYNSDLLNSLLFKLYNPRRISSTVSTALSNAWGCFRDKVATIQIDEASQMPQTAFYALVKTFPNACFTLVGDYHQLPPYCDPLTPSIAQSAGIGQLLKKAYCQRLIPSVTLHYVYRNHPEITKALGSAFYDYPLWSKIKPEDRSSKVKQSNWWINENYPFLFIQSSGNSALCHTSLYNLRELHVVDKLLESMGKVIELKDIGIATFYKAQTNMLMRKYQESDVFVGTVDSFQGREKEVIIVCLTNNSGRPSGFLLDKHRINVALSRARRAVIIIGNHNMIYDSPWASILKSIWYNGNVVSDDTIFWMLNSNGSRI